MPVSELMTTRLITVTPESTVGEMKAIFESSAIHHLLVVDDGRLLGVVSDRDVLRNVSPYVNTKAESEKDAFTLTRKAEKIMRKQLVTILPSSGIRDAGRMFLEHGVSLLPVVDSDQQLVGVLSWKDVMRYIID